jgi:Holliday junction resolvasome RuvABC endonuclease subunit
MRPSQAILGISPGTRSMGLAVMKGGELIEWRVKTFKGSWSHGKLKDILFVIMEYVQAHNIKIIALKKPGMHRSSGGLDQLASELTVWAKMNRIKVLSFTLQEMKRHYSKEKNFNKAEMIKQVALQYPELYSEYNKEQRNKKAYYVKMFEAVSIIEIFVNAKRILL